MGLRIMRSMAAHLGGDMEIRPAAQGKSINLAFPLVAPASGSDQP